jgi:TolB-like protein/tetratricopeptide (TPR) repeat protein
MSDIFLSYSRDDRATARRFAEAFEREGLTVWWDQTLRSGENYDQVTEAALRNAKAVVVLWSKHSVDSRWVRAEATQADRNGTLVPVMIEPCNRPIMFELKHTAELARWKGDAGDLAWKSFLGDVRQFVKKEAPGAAPAAPVQPAASTPRQFGVRTLIGVVALLVVGAGVFWVAGRSPKGITKSADSVTATAPAAAREVTLAVLPFVDFSTAHDQESFCDGLSEEILNQLAQVKGLTVTARTSSFSFKGKNEDMRVIAKALGVANLLEGSIQKEGKQLRVTAQLINGSSGTHMWSKTYARERKDVFAVQEEIAKDVAQALSIKLDVGDMPRAQGGTTNLDAWDRFLLAQAAYQRIGRDMVEAVRLYREATVLDPTFWRAWYGLAGVLAVVPEFAPDRAEAAARELNSVRAHLIADAPDSWAKQSMLAISGFEQRNWSQFEAASTAALEKMPTTATLDLIGLGLARLSVGHAREAAELLGRATRADPLTTGPSTALQLALDCSGRTADAQAEYERSKVLAGDHLTADGMSLQRLMGQPTTAPSAVQGLYRSLAVIHPEMKQAHADFEQIDDPVAARAAARRLLLDPQRQDVAYLRRTLSFADFVGDKETAITALQRISAESISRSLRLGDMPYLWLPNRTGLRADPRFKDIVRDLGLVDYWRTTGNWGDFCKPAGKDDFECH